jgi:glutamate 5-kinase
MSSSSNNTTPASSGLDDRALYHRVVVKAGTTLLTRGGDRLNLQVMATLVEQVARLRQEGTEIILVTSGAVAAGRHVLGAPREGRGVPFRQVLAAAGQGRLMHSYEQLFEWHQTPVAQALLSRKDLTERQGYLNVRNTLTQLMDLGVVPIVNENDVVAVDELAGEFFGDNDNLSAMVANLVDADLLVILGQTEGLFTADPHLDPDATLIPLVERVDETIEAAAGGSWQDQGQGGMTTKLEAARLATASGVDMAIASGLAPDAVVRLTRGERIGTFFPAAASKMESRKRWMLSGLSTKGRIVVDDGAAKVLRSRNVSLLPAGVTRVDGTFVRGDIVAVLDVDRNEIAAGITNYGSADVDRIKGRQSGEVEGLLGHQYGDEVVHRSNMVRLER